MHCARDKSSNIIYVTVHFVLALFLVSFCFFFFVFFVLRSFTRALRSLSVLFPLFYRFRLSLLLPSTPPVMQSARFRIFNALQHCWRCSLSRYIDPCPLSLDTLTFLPFTNPRYFYLLPPLHPPLCLLTQYRDLNSYRHIHEVKQKKFRSNISFLYNLIREMTRVVDEKMGKGEVKSRGGRKRCENRDSGPDRASPPRPRTFFS